MKAKLFSTAVVIFAAVNFAAAQQPTLQYYRALGQDRVSQFETGKADSVAFEEIKVRIGGAFALQFQGLESSNRYTLDNVNNDSPDPSMLTLSQKNGFNTAVANFNIDAQLADGIRMELVTYLSSLHHNEAWVKGGFIQIDKLAFLNSTFVDNLMENVTVKIGHMEINYGDGHFRRSDNGNAIVNPFVGNYIMDAFDTQIGGEVYYQNNGFIGMIGITEGEIKGNTVGTNVETGAAYYGKVGYDNYLNDDLRVRLTASLYTTEDAVNSNNLYSGDRAGTRYQNVLQPSNVSSPDFRAGRFNPGFRNKVTSIMVNPFVKYQGLEFFGLYEVSSGFAKVAGEMNEDASRTVNQVSGELIYRFLANESLYVGARYTNVGGELLATDINPDPNVFEFNKQSINRIQLTAGWFITKNVMAKIEYVKQNYNDWTAGSFLEDGTFDGFVFEAVVGF